MLDCVIRRAFFLSNLTVATAFRFVEAYHPTLLVDEADRFLAKNMELLGILNAGYRKGVVIPRCVGDDHEIKTFDPFCPKAIASIGLLADTLEDRAIVFQMKRRAEGERVDQFSQTKARTEYAVFKRLATRWAADNFEKLKNHEPVVPEGLNDREKDNWIPLLAVAEIAGRGWADRARKLAIAFSSSSEDRDSAGVILLSDVRSLFIDRKTDRLSSEDIIKALGEMEERPWPEWKNGKPITARQLARLLHRYDIKPKQLWIGQKSRGYELEDFKDAFSRYLPENPVCPVETVEFAPGAGCNTSWGPVKTSFDPVDIGPPTGNGIHIEPTKGKDPTVSTASTGPKGKPGAQPPHGRSDPSAALDRAKANAEAQTEQKIIPCAGMIRRGEVNLHIKHIREESDDCLILEFMEEGGIFRYDRKNGDITPHAIH